MKCQLNDGAKLRNNKSTLRKMKSETPTTAFFFCFLSVSKAAELNSDIDLSLQGS